MSSCHIIGKVTPSWQVQSRPKGNLSRQPAQFGVQDARKIWREKKLEPTSGLEPLTCRLRIGCSTTELPRPLIIKDLFFRFNPSVQLAFRPIQVSAVRYHVFKHECAASSEPTTVPCFGDNRVPTFHDALTFPEAQQGNRSHASYRDSRLIVASSDSVRKRLSLLALASTMPFNCQ